MVRISGLPRDPGHAGWNAILPPRRPGPALAENRTADWLIIGAGFTGLAAARRIRQIDASGRIVVLESRKIGEGPVGRNSGFMIDLPHILSSNSYSGNPQGDRKQIEMNRAAIAFAKDAVDEFQIPSEAFDPIGKINGAMTAKSDTTSNNYGTHLTNLGESYEKLDHQTMRDLTGSDAYLSGLFTPGTVMLQPAMFARGMADGLLAQGVEIYEDTPVQSYQKHAQGWSVRTPKGSATAPKVILAVNGQIERFGFFQKRLLHVYLYASLTQALTRDDLATLGGAPKWGITPADPMGSSLRRISGTGGDRILIRNRVTYDPNLRGRSHNLETFARSHRAGIYKRWPKLSSVKLDHTWGGALCLSQNDVPAFGEVEPGLIAAACQNGLGSVHGTFSGMLAADLAAGISSQHLEAQLSLKHPTRLPPLSALGAPLVLKAKEWKARGEI